MARRSQKDCPLCVPALSPENHALVYYEYQESKGDYPRTARMVTSLGSKASADEVRAHFQYHRIIQPSPKGHIRKAVALQKAEKMPARLRAIITLISRVPGLSGTQIAELFYWSGKPSQITSARAACYRDLQKLIMNDFVYRYYPQVVPRPGRGKKGYQDNISLYYLGRDAGPYIEKYEKYELSRKDWITTPGQLHDEYKNFVQHEGAEIVCALSRQAKGMLASENHLSLEGAPPLDAVVSPTNWYSRKQLEFDFTDPLTGRKENVRPGGIATIGLTSVQQGFSVLAPFFYEYDPGNKAASSYVSELLGYLYLQRSGVLNTQFSQLPRRSYFPPVIVVCSDMKRVIDLQQEMKLLIHKRGLGGEQLPVVILTDSITHAKHGLSGKSWLSLWDHSLEVGRVHLLEALLHSCKPLVSLLTADTDFQHVSPL